MRSTSTPAMIDYCHRCCERQRNENLWDYNFNFNLSKTTFTSLPSISVLCIFENLRLSHSILIDLKMSQRLTEYGVHFHRVLPEKRSQTGIMLGVYSKGVLIFEVLNGNRTPVLRFPWRETKKISFVVCTCVFIIRNKTMPHFNECNVFTLTLPSWSSLLLKCLICHPEEKEDLPSEHIRWD